MTTDVGMTTEAATTGSASAGTAGRPLLEVRGLTVTYGTPTPAVDHIDLQVGEREAVALLGANGAGKTSTLRAISGLISSTGAADLDGEDQARRQPEAIARSGIIHIPEGRRLFGSLSVEENLLIGGTGGQGANPCSASTTRTISFPSSPASDAVEAGRSPVASSRWWPSAGPCWPRPGSCCSTSPRSVWRRWWWSRCSRRCTPSPTGWAMVLVEQNAGLALDLCGRAYVLATGRVAVSGTHAELPSREDLLATYLAD